MRRRRGQLLCSSRHRISQIADHTLARWPKMDLTNSRSMELFRRLGLAQDLRDQGEFQYCSLYVAIHHIVSNHVLGVASHMKYPVLISTGLHTEECVTKWDHPSVDEYRVRITEKNDGTMPLEPYQRLSQVHFEKWLRGLCDQNPNVDVRYNQKFESLQDCDGGVKALTTDLVTGEKKTIMARYLVGCDGASSRVRRGLDIPLDGGPMYVNPSHSSKISCANGTLADHVMHSWCISDRET